MFAWKNHVFAASKNDFDREALMDSSRFLSHDCGAEIVRKHCASVQLLVGYREQRDECLERQYVVWQREQQQ